MINFTVLPLTQHHFFQIPIMPASPPHMTKFFCLIAPSFVFAIAICNSDKQLCIAMKSFNAVILYRCKHCSMGLLYRSSPLLSMSASIFPLYLNATCFPLPNNFKIIGKLILLLISELNNFQRFYILLFELFFQKMSQENVSIAAIAKKKPPPPLLSC